MVQRWRKEGVFDAVLLALADDLWERGKLDLREAFIRGFSLLRRSHGQAHLANHTITSSGHECS